MELKLEHITKEYNKGKIKALYDFSSIMKPGVYGLLGPNGAGKSTLMNIITDNLQQTEGTVSFNGSDIKKLGKKYRTALGYMPQQQGLYDEFTANRFLWYMAALKGLKKAEAKSQIEELVALVNLRGDMQKKLKAFSGGMKQRLLIAQALLGNPQILILDEPTTGLDPKERIRIRNFISEIGKEKIVLLASHVVQDIEFIAKEILLLKKGVLVAKDTPNNLLKRVEGKVFELYIEENALQEIQKRFKVSNLYHQKGQVVARIVTEESVEDWDYKNVSPTLEDLYLHIFE